MIKTTWTCDRCSKTQDTPEQMWVIKVNLQHLTDVGRYATINTSYEAVTVHWCRVCCEAFELLGRHANKAQQLIAPAPTPTLEDLLREIVREEIQQVNL